MQIIQLAFDQVPDASGVKATTTLKTTVLPAGIDFAFVDSSGGPITITLPTTSDVTITFRSISNSTNPVKIQTADATKVNVSQAFMTLDPLGTLAFRYCSTTKGWFTL
jgi:hypothetical protein